MRSRQRLTIRDIAREAGVSTATVSRVINQPGTVSPGTRASVQTVIEQNSYVSDGIAGSLASARSVSIGLVIPTITNSIYASSTQATQGIAQSAGYTVLLGISEFSSKLEEKLIRKLLERRVDGLILTGGDRSPNIYDLIDSNDVPLVITWKLLTGGDARPSVSFDNYKGARLAMEHLIGLGHQRIGLICGRTGINDRARDRRDAYQDAMQAIGKPIDLKLIHEADFELAQGRAAMRKLLALKERPTAVFCANDIQAIGALFECGETNLRVPDDMSLIGFDDLPVAQYTRPQLTTIHVPAQRMGELAAIKLIGAIDTGLAATTEELPVKLVLRSSTAPPRRNSKLGVPSRQRRSASG